MKILIILFMITVSIDTSAWKDKVRNYTQIVQTKLDAEVKTAALNIDRNAKKNCPVDTGRLRASIHPQFKGTKSYQYNGKFGNFDGFINITVGVFEAIIGSNVEYAEKVEAKSSRPHYLSDAVFNEKPDFENRVKKIFKQ